MWVKKGNIFNMEWSQLPIVDVLPDFYRIYYSTRDEQNRSIPRSIVFSKDLEKHPPIHYQVNIPLGKPGSFDSHGVMPTEIVTLEDGTKYLYYVGWSKRLDVPYWNSLGLAISKDNGVTWKKYSEGPIFTSGYRETGFMGTCCVLPPNGEDREWLMYYSSAHWEEIGGKQECIYDLKIARSHNGVFWYHWGETALSLLKGEGGLASPRIVKNGDYEWVMYFSTRQNKDYRTNPKKSYKIRTAYSNDLLNWKRVNSGEEFLLPSGDENMTAYPFIISEENRDIMFYNGKDFGKSGISYAERIKK